MKALIVDDAKFMRNLLEKNLLEAGMEECAQAEDGYRAIEEVQRDTFDLILMDWNMPGMNGVAAVKEIRSLGIKTPILMVTTEAQKPRVVEALRAGASNYLAKPFTTEDLCEKVHQLLGQVMPTDEKPGKTSMQEQLDETDHETKTDQGRGMATQRRRR